MMFKTAIFVFSLNLFSVEGVRKDIKEQQRIGRQKRELRNGNGNGSGRGKGSSLDVDTFCALTERFDTLARRNGEARKLQETTTPNDTQEATETQEETTHRALYGICNSFSDELLEAMCPSQKLLCDSKTSYVTEFCGAETTYFSYYTGPVYSCDFPTRKLEKETSSHNKVQQDEAFAGGRKLAMDRNAAGMPQRRADGYGEGGTYVNIAITGDKSDAQYPCLHDGCSTFLQLCCETTCCEKPDLEPSLVCDVYAAADPTCAEIDNRYCPCSDNESTLEEFCTEVAGEGCSACVSYVNDCCGPMNGYA